MLEVSGRVVSATVQIVSDMHHTVIPIATQMSLILVWLPPIKPARQCASWMMEEPCWPATEWVSGLQPEVGKI